MLLLDYSIKVKFIETLKVISNSAGKGFSGLGILLYDSNRFLKLHFSDLRPSFSCPQGLCLGDEKTISYLFKIAEITSPLHDGFIFFNELGRLTHISQYFAPLPINKIIPNENYGTRYRTAQYGSLLEGVLLIGVICHDMNFFIFSKGRIVNSNNIAEYNEDLKIKMKTY